jgi:hypothetical protein
MEEGLKDCYMTVTVLRAKYYKQKKKKRKRKTKMIMIMIMMIPVRRSSSINGQIS